ncbi:MAG: hypothetical protein AVDCRST_MAG37-3432, partial [uncultured Rubrobacteraceae bacterium]
QEPTLHKLPQHCSKRYEPIRHLPFRRPSRRVRGFEGFNPM